MLDARPKEPICLSWLYVTIASLAIFVTVPFARAIQNGIAARVEGRFIVYLVVAIVAAVIVAIVRNLRRRQTSLAGYLWLLGVAAAYAAYAYELRRNSIEMIHLVEYGLLSLLVFRALVHRVRDISIYPIAVVIVGTVGIVDEWIQWIAPTRFWGLSDIQINLTAGALMQLAIGVGLRPALIAGRPSSGNLARLFVVTALGLFLLGLSFANTPERIGSYATRIPSMSFLMNSRSMMAEYGYLYNDSQIGSFRSRLTLNELEANDRTRGPELAAILDKFINDKMYGTFHDIYTVPRDAWVHEAGVHLFLRNRALHLADTEELRRDVHFNIAHRENRILEKYFSAGLSHSHHVWTVETRERVAGLAEKEPAYVSRVSSDVITRISEAQVLAVFGIAVIALLLAAAFCYKRNRNEPNVNRR